MTPLRRFLVVDDAGARMDEYVGFQEDHRDSHGIKFLRASTPRKAMELLTKHLDMFDGGVIADFALGAHRDDSQGAKWRHEVLDDSDGRQYAVSTGLGILDWVHQRSPRTPLWALTESDAAHAPLFMSAANLWLGANPLQTRRFSDAPEIQRRLADELLNPGRARDVNPIYTQVIDESAPAFHTLMNTVHKDVEPMEWLYALATLPRPTRRHGFEEIVQHRIKELTDREIRIYFHRGFAESMAQWQHQLRRIYEQFPDVKRSKPWPEADPQATNLEAWNDVNPFSDYLGRKPECLEFLEAPDVRVALARWRDRNETW